MKTVRSTLKNMLIAGIGISSLALMLVVHNQEAIASLLFNANDQLVNDTFTNQGIDISVSSTVPTTIDNTFNSLVTYGVRVVNTTSSTVENVVVKTVVPTGLTITMVQAGCTQEGNTMICNLPSLLSNASRNFLVRASAPAKSLCSQTLTNTATVSTTSAESNTSNNQISAQTTFTCTTGTSSVSSANSSISASATDIAVTTVAPITLTNDNGNEWIYRITVMNMTTVAAQKISLLFTTPSTIRIPTVPSGCIKVGNDISCKIDRLNALASTSFTIGAATTARTLCDNKIQTDAVVSTDTAETNKVNNQASTITTFTCSGSHSSANSSTNSSTSSATSSNTSTGSPRLDLAITKNAPATVANDFASIFNYTIVVSNTTEEQAQRVVIRDVIPSNLTIVTVPLGCTKNGNEITCNVDAINRYSSKTFNISVSVPAKTVCGQSVTNTALISTDATETNINNNQASASTSFTCSSPKTELAISAPSPGARGNNSFPAGFNYDITVKNESLVNADNVVVTAVIPPPFTVRIMPNNCKSNGNTVTCTMPPLRWYSDYTVTLPVITPARTVCDQTVTFAASVATSTPEENLANNQASFSMSFWCLLPETSLAVSTTAPSEMDNATDSTIVYNVTVSNTSDVAAYNVVADHSFIRYVPYTGSNVYRALFPLPPYTVETLPTECTQLKFPSNNKIQCSFFVLQPYESKSYVIRISAPKRSVCRDRMPFITNVTTTTTVKGHKPIGTTSLTLFRCTEEQAEETDLQITHTAPPTVANDTSSSLNYTITVKNPTASSISNIVVTDAIPASMEIVSAEGCTKQGQNLTCAIGTLASNATRTLTIGVAVPDHTFCGQLISNVATITSATPDTNPNNNQASADTTFTCSTNSTDLSITQSAPSTIYTSTSATFNYVIGVKNNTAVPARDIVIKETIPSELTITSLPTNCTKNGNTILCTVASMQGNSTIEVKIGVTASAGSLCGQTRTSSATVSTATSDTNAFNNQASASVVFMCSSSSSSRSSVSSSSSVPLSSRSSSSISASTTDLSISMSAPSSADNTGVSTINYTITVKNTSSTIAENVMVADSMLPSLYTVLDRLLPAGCTVNSQNLVSCALGTMNGKSMKTIIIPIAYREKAMCNKTSSNWASVTSSTLDVNTGNNKANAQTLFTCTEASADLELKITGPTQLTKSSLSQKFTHKIVVKNLSTTAAKNVAIRSTLPNKTAMGYSAVPSECTFSSTTEYGLICDIGNLAGNASYTLDINLATVTPFNCNQTVTHTVSTISESAELNWMNNLARVQTFFYCP